MSDRVEVLMKPAGNLFPRPLLAPFGTLQRRCACGGAKSECEECEKKHTLQRRAAGSEAPVAVPSIVHDVLDSPGQPLDAETRSFFEPRFGHDFSRVRVHIDAKAAESARAVNALAYTVGRDVVFSAGQYLPGTDGGRGLLAHELTHVVQQAATPNCNEQLSLGSASSSYESEADLAAHSVISPLYDRTTSVGAVAEASASMRPTADAPAGTVRRQVLSPGVQGSGFTGIYKRLQRSAFARLYPPGWRPTMRTIKVWFNTFIPMAQIKGPRFYDCFTGDGRGFSNAIHASSRTHQEIEFDVTTFAKTIDWKDTGTSHEVDCKTGAVEHAGKAPVSELTNGGVVPDPAAGQIKVSFQVSATNPLLWTWAAPAIDADVVFYVDPVHRHCTLTGEHDGFPAYEAYVTADGGAGNKVYTYDPRAAGEGIWALLPPMDKTVSGAGTSF